MLFTLRVSLADRPGSLGALAGALGRGGANIVSMEVVERSEGLAVDELTVEAPTGLQEALKVAAAEVAGLLVEDMRPADMFLDLYSPLELAALLVGTPADKVMSLLVEKLAGAVWADWVATVDGSAPVRVVQASTGSPTFEGLETPWMPLEGAVRLQAGDWMPPEWTRRISATPELKPELAAVPLYGESVLMVGREKGPRFRQSELAELSLLAQIAVTLCDCETAAWKT